MLRKIATYSLFILPMGLYCFIVSIIKSDIDLFNSAYFSKNSYTLNHCFSTEQALSAKCVYENMTAPIFKSTGKKIKIDKELSDYIRDNVAGKGIMIGSNTLPLVLMSTADSHIVTYDGFFIGGFTDNDMFIQRHIDIHYHYDYPRTEFYPLSFLFYFGNADNFFKLQKIITENNVKWLVISGRDYLAVKRLLHDCDDYNKIFDIEYDYNNALVLKVKNTIYNNNKIFCKSNDVFELNNSKNFRIWTFDSSLIKARLYKQYKDMKEIILEEGLDGLTNMTLKGVDLNRNIFLETGVFVLTQPIYEDIISIIPPFNLKTHFKGSVMTLDMINELKSSRMYFFPITPRDIISGVENTFKGETFSFRINMNTYGWGQITIRDRFYIVEGLTMEPFGEYFIAYKDNKLYYFKW